MSVPFRRRRILFAALATAALSHGALGQVSGSWTGLAGTSFWADGGNWSSDPLFPSGGGAATFANATAYVLVNQPVTLSSVTFDGLGGNHLPSLEPLSFSGPAMIDTRPAAGVSNPAALLWTRHTIETAVQTSAGLVKSGAGALRLGGFAQTYTGGTTVSGGTLLFEEVDQLGAEGSMITLNGGTLRAESASFFPAGHSLNRHLVIGAGGGTLDMTHAMSSGTGTASLSGTGPLTVIAGHGSLAPRNAAGFSGAIHVYGGGTSGLSLAPGGTLPASSAVHVAGYLQLNGDANLIGDAAPVTLRRALVETFFAAVPAESIGTLTLAGGGSWFKAVGLDTPALVRQNRATLVAAALSSAPGAPQLRVGNASALLVGGTGPAGSDTMSIVPFVTHGAAIESAGLVTNSPAGLRPLDASEYASVLPTGPTQQNVRLTGATSVTAPGTVNALVLSNAATLSGSAAVTVGSGLVVCAAPAIAAPLNFGAAEGIIRAGTTTLSSPINGSNGLTLIGGNVNVTGTSSYTGATTLNGGSFGFTGDVLPGVPGPFGADASPVILAGDNGYGVSGAPAAVVLRGAGTLARGLVVAGDPRDGYAAQLIGLNVTGGVVLDGPLRVAGTTTLSGPVTGAGTLTVDSGSTLRLRAAHARTGATHVSGGTAAFNNGAAFGTGPILAGYRYGSIVAGAALVGEGTAALTVNNPIVVLTSLFVGTATAAPLTLTGSVDLQGNAATFGTAENVTVAGTIHNGTFVSSGSATRLTGNDNRQRANVVAAGTLRVEADRALGRSPAYTEVRSFGTLALAGGVSVPAHPLELIDTGSLRGISGNNVWLGPVTLRRTSTGSGTTTFAVDAGTLTIRNDVRAGTFHAVVKGGAGTLRLERRNPLTAGLGLATFTVGGGAVELAPDGTSAGVSDLRHLAFTGGPAAPAGRFDIADNGLIINAGVTSPIGEIAGYVRAGYAGGGSAAWTGNGITTSLGDAGAFGVGFGQARDIYPTTPRVFMGITVTVNDVLLRYTRYGDANLDGTVNLQDFNRLAANFGQANRFWHHGDFNYDGVVNLQDFNRLAGNFGLSAAGADVTPQDWAKLAAAVPEPGAGAALAGAATGVALRGRRRRRGRNTSNGLQVSNLP